MDFIHVGDENQRIFCHGRVSSEFGFNNLIETIFEGAHEIFIGIETYFDLKHENAINGGPHQ